MSSRLENAKEDTGESDGPAEPAAPLRDEAVTRHGFNLHASLTIAADDDLGRERLCRYGLLPPLSLSRLRVLRDGRISYRVKRSSRGANGARVRLAPQKDWEVNEPAELARVLRALAGIQQSLAAAQSDGKKNSLADLVLGGSAAIERAAKDAGHDVTVPFTPGRTDASQDQTDVGSFAVLEPRGDGFRNYLHPDHVLSPETLLLDRANMLMLTAPEMTVLVGGMRVLAANHAKSRHEVFTSRPGTLTNDFFVNLLDNDTEWQPSSEGPSVYEGRARGSKDVKWTATAVDLVFGSHSQLRGIAEVYASADAKEKLVRDFVAAWTKVMNLDRFDVAGGAVA